MIVKYFPSNLFSGLQTDFELALNELSVSCVFEAYEEENLLNDLERIDKASDDLRNDLCQGVIIKLSSLPAGYLPEDITIASLSKRHDQFDAIQFSPSSNKDSLVNLSNGQKIKATDLRSSALMSDLFPHAVSSVLSQEEAIHLKEFNFGEGVLFKIEDYKLTEREGYSTFVFHPREFIPAAGQNVLAVLCRRSDLRTLEIFRKFHQSEVASCTNLERLVAKALSELNCTGIGCYCYMDANSYYHLYVSCILPDGVFKRHMLSSGTSGGLVESVVKTVLGD